SVPATDEAVAITDAAVDTDEETKENVEAAETPETPTRPTKAVHPRDAETGMNSATRSEEPPAAPASRQAMRSNVDASTKPLSSQPARQSSQSSPRSSRAPQQSTRAAPRRDVPHVEPSRGESGGQRGGTSGGKGGRTRRKSEK